MKKKQIHGILFLVLLFFFFSGCSNSLDEVRRITPTELREKFSAGQAIIMDTRAVDAFNLLHIMGAISMPYAQVTERAHELPRDKLVATYCT